MKKKTPKTKSTKQYHESPLVASTTEVLGKAKKGKEEKSFYKKKDSNPKRARKEAMEDLEEQELTSLVFGNTTTSALVGGGAEAEEPLFAGAKSSTTGTAFKIDRKGDDDGSSDNDDDNDDDDDASDSDDGDEKEDTQRRKKSKHAPAAAWQDDEGDDIQISLVEGSDRVKKLRKSRKELAPLKGAEFENRLRKRFNTSTGMTARVDWAQQALKKKQDDDNNDDDDDDDDDNNKKIVEELFTTSGSLLQDSRGSSSHVLPPNVLGIIRCPDANQVDPGNATLQAIQFHPGSDPEEPLLLTAGLDKTLRFFQVGKEKSEKIHGIHFPKLPIYSASFLGSTGNVVVSGRRPFFYIFDAVSGKVDLIPRILGRAEKSLEKHVASPNGQFIAFYGNDGYVILVDSKTKHWVGDLKLNGSVRAITFTPDGQYVLASGSDGDVYRWDIRSRKCVERFSNNDGTITASLAASSRHVAVGAESGVVNLYSDHKIMTQKNNSSSSSEKQLLKSIMNLKTSAELLRFNSDGNILAMSTRREQDGLKLLHVPSQTVFSNWPTSKTPLKYVWSLDFSPQSKYLAIGNDKGKCLLYSLNHYQD